jgi:hypothetical protein
MHVFVERECNAKLVPGADTLGHPNLFFEEREAEEATRAYASPDWV